MIFAALGVAESSARTLQSGSLSLPAAADEPVTLRVRLPESGEPLDWSRHLAVFVEEAGTSLSTSPVQGAYRIGNDTLAFQPDFPFSPDVKYRVDIATELVTIENLRGVNLSRLGREFVGFSFSLPASPPLAPPQVQRVFPTGEELPANILRFYIYFSSPMQRGWASRAISLQDEDGHEIENVFMEFKQELWSPNQRRLTVFLDPGRIKRGVSTNERLGDALQVGGRYRFVVDASWPDASGNSLRKKYEKAFRVTPPLRSTVDPDSWILEAPAAGSNAPLKLTVDRPLDHALLQRLLHVQDEGDNEVPGRIELGRKETQWLMFPQHPWRPGEYRLHIQPELEDLAGNNLSGPLDRSVTDARTGGHQVIRRFAVAP